MDIKELKEKIRMYIKQNNMQEITGDILQNILVNIVDTLGELPNSKINYINLINNDISTSKGYLNEQGEFVSLNYYRCTDYIYLEPNVDYTLISFAQSDARIVIYNSSNEIEETFTIAGKKNIEAKTYARSIRISNDLNSNPDGFKLFKNEDNSVLNEFEKTNYVNLNDTDKWYIGDCITATGEKNIDYSAKRITLKEAYNFKSLEINNFINIPNYFIWYCYDIDMKYIGFSNDRTLESVKGSYPNAVYFRLCLQYDNQPEIDWVKNYMFISNAKININFSIPEELEKLLLLYGIENKKEISLNEQSYWFVGSVITANGQKTMPGIDNERLTTELINIIDNEVDFNINIGNELYTNIYCYDVNKNYLGNHTSTTSISKSWSIREAKEKYSETYYVRLSIILNREASIDDIGSNLTINSPINAIIPKGYDIRPELRDYSFGNILYRKKWVACGDSFTAGGYNGSEGIPQKEYVYQEGIYKGQNIVYPYIIGLRNNMYIWNEAVSGSTMAKSTSPTGSFSENRYKNIPPDADYITLYFGINDDNYNVPIGSIDDTENTTFYGAWNIVMEYLIEHHPFAHIGIIITNGANTEIMEAERNIAIKWGIPYLDYADVQTPLMNRMDGMRSEVCDRAFELRNEAFRINEINTHPNTMAHYYESTFIENFLRRI